MRARVLMVPVLSISLLFFVVAAFLARSDDQALAWAAGGVMVPIVAIVLLQLAHMLRWRGMGKRLGLVPQGNGAYPDLAGPYKGRRLVIMRRSDPTGMGPRLSTIVRLEGVQELRLPGVIADPATVRSVLKPFLERA